MNHPPGDERDEDVEREFYEELVRRNAGIVSRRQQAALREARVLVAGCGSVGGAAVQPLTRLGVRDFVVVDTGDFELNNLNRQQATIADIGRNKAEVAAERITSINPHARVEVHADGVTEANVEHLVAGCAVVVDGVDVTTRSGLVAKCQLHEAAIKARKALITGWDMAGAQYVQLYDYRRRRDPFDGRITRDDVERLNPWEVILRLIPSRRIPTEMMAEVAPRLTDPSYSVPQVVYAALPFGAITSHMVARILAQEPVRHEVAFDVHAAVGPRVEQVRQLARRPQVALRLLRARRALG